MVFVVCGGRCHFLQILFAQSTGSTPLHLFKVVLAADITHEDQTLQRLDISSCGDHIHSYSNTGIKVVAQC